ncbi:MAG: NADH-quinone oxidoreductase subunit I [Actinobacteria bacterium]|nr:NADH-quinone oxidoreductase subunit I [Actinomycetota bacterium]
MLGAGLVQGLKTTLRAFFTKPVTILWPYQKVPIASQGQGLIRLRMTQLDPPVYKCTGCGICASNCPQRCISVEKKGGEKQPEIYTVNYGLCMFCRICIDVCPFDALQQTQEHEFIGESRDDFIRRKEELAMNSVFADEKTAAEPEENAK